MSQIKLVGFSGSLREGSLNTSLLNSLSELMPDGATFEPLSIAEIPLYNADLDVDGTRPEAVEAFKSAIDAADGLVVVSPEYNYGVPGVVKNALDWASRPGFASPLKRKPVGLMGVGPGASGTMRMQEKLKSDLVAMLCQLFPHPGVAVRQARPKFDESGLVDESTREFIADYLAGLVEWVGSQKS